VRAGQRAPAGTLTLADQEGGTVKAFPGLPPWLAASRYRSDRRARVDGASTGRALRAAGVGVDLAPVLDAAGGPLGTRHFRRPSLGVSFARGLLEGGAGACAKHFPGLGSTAVSTDDRPHVDGVVRERELNGFRAAIRTGVPCVMIDNAFYRRFGPLRASLAPRAYRLLRSLGFDGVAITDSLSIVEPTPAWWPAAAIRAGADMVLFTNPRDASVAARTLVPLARRGELDEHVERVLAFRARFVG